MTARGASAAIPHSPVLPSVALPSAELPSVTKPSLSVTPPEVEKPSIAGLESSLPTAPQALASLSAKPAATGTQAKPPAATPKTPPTPAASGASGAPAEPAEANAAPPAQTYCLQLGSFPNLKAAQQLQAALKEKGYTATIFEGLDSGYKAWHTVRFSEYPDIVSASSAAAAFTSKEKLQAIVRPVGQL